MAQQEEKFIVRIMIGTDIKNGYWHNAVLYIDDECKHLKAIYIHAPDEIAAELIAAIPDQHKLENTLSEGSIAIAKGVMTWDDDFEDTEQFKITEFTKKNIKFLLS